MSTYVPRDKRDKHIPANHAQFDTPEIKAKRFWITLFGLLVGPPLLLGGIAVVWLAVAWIIVGLFHLFPVGLLHY